MGRTGKLFAYELYGVAPDILASAKGIGGGFPLGAVLSTAEAGKGMGAGQRTARTYGGNPLAMACGNAVLDVVLAPGFLDDVARKGLLLRQSLAALAAEHPDVVAEIRGEGLMQGLRLRVPNTDFAAAARAEKIIVIPAADNVVRILPPLVDLRRRDPRRRAPPGRGMPPFREGPAAHGDKQGADSMNMTADRSGAPLFPRHCGFFARRAARHPGPRARDIKRRRRKGRPAPDKPLAGRTLAMIFDKPSTRTRVSFDVGMRELGGETLDADRRRDATRARRNHRRHGARAVAFRRRDHDPHPVAMSI